MIIRKLFPVLILIILLPSCRKKKKMNLEGTYTGTEHYVLIDGFSETLVDTTYTTTLTLTLTDNKTFLVEKTTYPGAYDIPANELVKEGSVTEHGGISPRRVWTVRVDGDKIYGDFEETNVVEGTYKTYTFEGSK